MTARGAALLLWLAFAVTLIVAGAMALRACGSGWILADFCTSEVTEADLLAQRQEELRTERDAWLHRIGAAPQCRRDDRQAELDCQPPPTDETLILVDVSNSMGWDYNSAAQAEIARLQEAMTRATDRFQMVALANRMAALADSPAKPDRLDVARAALLPLAGGLAEGARLRLLSFASCRVPIRQEGVFSAADAQSYADRVAGLRLRNDTALAEAIAGLPAQTEAGRSPDRPVNILILSDGEDSCGGNPCAAAAGLRRELPFAHVSVVSLAPGLGMNACIAEATGGTFLTAADTDDLDLTLRRTAGQLSAAECRALPPLDTTE